MELLERYIHAVGKYLSQKQRKDIQEELRSLILDTLEGSFGKKESYTDEEIEKVLKDFGPPREVAARYSQKPRHLIGPDFFDLFLVITAIACGATTLGIVISMLVNLAPQLNDFLGVIKTLGTTAIMLLQSYIGIIGFMTLLFAILEHVVPNNERKGLERGDKWSPKALPKLPDYAESVKPIALIMNCLLVVVAMLVFNKYSDLVALYIRFPAESGTRVFPILSDAALYAYLPLWNLLWFGTIVLNLALLVMKKWSYATRIFDIIIAAFNIYILFKMASGPILFIDQISAAAAHDIIDGFNLVLNLFKDGSRIFFAFVGVVSIFELIKKVIKLLNLEGIEIEQGRR